MRFSRSSTSQEERESPIDPDRHCGGSHKINTFPDTHSGVAHQVQDIGGQIIAAEQFLLNELILLGCQGAWQPLRSTRNVLATDKMGKIGDLRAPGKLFQHAAHEQQASDVDRGS